MTNGLTATSTKILTWLVYALIFFLTTVTGWQQIKLTNLSNEYVRLERYKADATRSEGSLQRIENKIDQLIMEERKK